MASRLAHRKERSVRQSGRQDYARAETGHCRSMPLRRCNNRNLRPGCPWFDKIGRVRAVLSPAATGFPVGVCSRGSEYGTGACGVTTCATLAPVLRVARAHGGASRCLPSRRLAGVPSPDKGGGGVDLRLPAAVEYSAVAVPSRAPSCKVLFQFTDCKCHSIYSERVLPFTRH